MQVDSYDPEYVDAIESGLKSRWLGSRVQLNVAAFLYDYTDKQDFQRITLPSGQTTFEIQNASAATSSGFELELQAQVTDGLLIDLSLGYLSSEFDEFDTIDVQSSVGGGLRDLEGNKLPFSPEWSAHVGMQYDWDLLSSGSMSARVDYSWSDEQFSNAFNRNASSGLAGDADFVPSYFLVNAYVRWASVDAHWLAEVYAKNLTDEIILSNPFVSNAQESFGTYLAPRTYGLSVTYSF